MKMNPEQINKISKIVGEEMVNEQDNKLIDDLQDRFQKLKLNLQTRKRIAKSLSIDEKKAMNWKTVGDVFSFIDTSDLAQHHPEEASRLLKIIAGIVGVAFPVTLPVTGAILVLPPMVAAKLVEYLGKPTPEHVVHKLADYQAEKFRLALEEGEPGDDVTEYIDVEEITEDETDYTIPESEETAETEQIEEEEETSEPEEEIQLKPDDNEVIDSIEMLYTLCQRGIITEEDFNTKKDELLKKLS